MQVQYNPSYIPELVKASQVLDQAKKDYILSQLPSMSEEKKQQVFRLLAKEHTKLFELNQQRIAANTHFLEKKTKATNTFTEAISAVNEKSVLKSLDASLTDAFEEQTEPNLA